MSSKWRAVAALALALATASCSVSGPGSEAASTAADAPAHGSNQDRAHDAGPTASADEHQRVYLTNGDGDAALIATATDDEVDVWDEPSGAVVSTVAADDVLTSPDTTPLVFLVKQRRAAWLEVYLPVRPNGTTGWVRQSQVTLTATTYRLDAYLADHRLVLTDDGDQLASYAIGVGASDKPTPGGVYYLRELLVPPNPNDVYGVYAYGLSGFSPVLDSFRGGDAVIGLHGTNDPSSIGKDVSHGCMRLRNEDVTELVERYGLPLGTPVYIHE